jgi:broad specificity phosphatase PhoE
MIAFVRHGQTDANRDQLLVGRADVPLNELGRAQAATAAVAMATPPIVVVTSPLARARETAEIIAEHWASPLEIDDRLIELDYGEWDRRPIADLGPDAWSAWRADAEFVPPGGESLTALQARVTDCVAGLLARSGDGVIVAVSHVSPIKAAAAWALTAGPELSWRLRLEPGSITRIAMATDGPQIVTWNEVPRPVA